MAKARDVRARSRWFAPTLFCRNFRPVSERNRTRANAEPWHSCHVVSATYAALGQARTRAACHVRSAESPSGSALRTSCLPSVSLARIATCRRHSPRLGSKRVPRRLSRATGLRGPTIRSTAGSGPANRPRLPPRGVGKRPARALGPARGAAVVAVDEAVEAKTRLVGLPALAGQVGAAASPSGRSTTPATASPSRRRRPLGSPCCRCLLG
jgi:hypothetical protein